jgi:predicted HTH domain antitoxin
VTTINVNFPEGALAALGESCEQLAEDLRVAAAIYWYAQGKLSQERAAEAAGLNRRDFILALGRARVDVFQTDYEEFVNNKKS